jgi:hypothetical protein
MVHGTDSDGNRVTWEDLSSEVPAIKNIYEYRNDELLAKLYQVKEWLERYVTGVGCYISDINGESVVLERIKNEAYITGGEVKDMTTVGKFTPHATVKEGSVFTDSSICITCGLNEFRSLSFEDYADFPIERFVKWSYDTDGNEIPMTANVTVGRSKQEMPVYISAPLSALTVADEFRYTLELNHPNSGSLYEFADASCLDNPIVVADGEITLFNTKKKSSSITNSPTDKNASNECPVIEISKGNIREVYGDWAPDSSDNNIAWSIMSGYADDGNLYVTLSSQSPDYLYETTDTEMHNKYPEYDATHIYPEFKFKGSVLLTPERNAKLEYTSVNKWGVPMIIVSGYYPSNQMTGDYVGHRDFRAARPDYFPRERKFILEIFEGTMKFRNHHDVKQLKHCIGADVIFGDATVEEGEQPVFINFKWQSDRIPVYEVQTNELLNKLNTTQFNDFQEVQDCMSDYLKTNTEVDVPVNRLGDYWVSIQAYDAYNNIYANRGDDIINVQSDMPDIEILVNQEDSNNTLDFFVGNATYDPSVEDERVHLLTPDEINDASAAIKTIPEFPKEYRIYSATHETSTNVIVYDNISYALDTPKEGDRLILTNMTESAYSVTKTDNYVHIGMNSGNPRKQQIYNAGGTVTLCVWDENTKTILAETEDVSVQRCVYPTEEEQESVFYENGSIEVAVSDWNNSDVSPYIDNINDHDSGVELYVIDTTEIDVTKYIDYVVIDTSTNDGSTYFNMTFVPVDEKDADNFNEDTMVKMRVEFTDKEQNCKMFVNEAAFRVLKKDIRHTETADKETTEYGYWLLGRINTDFFDKLRQRNIFMYDKDLTDELNENAKAENKQMAYSIDNLRITLRPLHSSAVEYELRVTEDADETLYVYNDFKFYGQKTEVKYDDGQLMFGAYLDDQYSARVMRYDPEDLISIWNTDMIEGDVYSYRNYPVTVEPGRKVIICSDKDVPQLADGWKVLWKWKTYVIEDMSNLQNTKPQDMNKILLFESINDVISVKPQLLGSQFIELYLTDVYGNVIANKGGGNLMVQNYDDEDEVTLL